MLRHLYQKVTRDVATDECTVMAHINALPLRYRQILEWRAMGLLLREISDRDGHAHPATLSTFIRRMLNEIRKKIEADASRSAGARV